MSSDRDRIVHGVLIGLALLVGACSGGEHRDSAQHGRESLPAKGHPERPAYAERRERDAAELASLLLDTELHELRATLAFKIRNPDRYDESPLADSILPPGPPPGPHQFDGTVFAELETLRRILPAGPRVRVEGDAVFVGEPEVLIHGHRHGPPA